MRITVLNVRLVAIPTVKSRFQLQTSVVIRQHFGIKNVGQTVIIHVRQIRTHRSRPAVIDLIFKILLESAVFLIDIKIISLKKIVANVNILPPISVNIAHHDAQTKGLHRAINARFR